MPLETTWNRQGMSVATSTTTTHVPSDVPSHLVPSSILPLHIQALLHGIDIRRINPRMQTLARTIIPEHKQPRQPVPATGDEQRRAVEPRYVGKVAVRLVRHVLDDGVSRFATG